MRVVKYKHFLIENTDSTARLDAQAGPDLQGLTVVCCTAM